MTIRHGTDHTGPFVVVTCDGDGAGDGCAAHIAVRPGPGTDATALEEIAEELALDEGWILGSRVPGSVRGLRGRLASGSMAPEGRRRSRAPLTRDTRDRPR